MSNSSDSINNCQSADFIFRNPCSYSSPVVEQEDVDDRDDDMTFCMSNYAKEVLKMMFMMRSHNMLTDVILEVKQELFPAHKVVLSAASPYFKAMFTGGLKESEMSRVQLQGVCQEEEFLQLTAYQLIALIRRDELNVQEEREVYNAVLKWVKYDEENRYPKMEHILCAVRCQFLTPNFLKEQMRNCDVLRKVPACREYLAKIFKDLTLHKRPVVKERTPNTTRMIFVAGGFFRQSLDILEAYNVDDKTWTILPNLRIPRSGLGAAFLKGTFYAVGGRNNSIGSSYDSDWVDRYNAATEQWRPCAPMTVPRHRVGVAVMDELMYAIGGSAGSEYHNSVEYYDPEQDRWTLVQPMHEKRLGVGVVVVNRLLYAIGGFNGTDRLTTVECYHPENNEWTFVQPMQYERSGAGVAAINQFIYVVGGFDGTRQLATVERYDTENQIWELVAPVRIARSALSLTPLDGKLYAIGGFDGTNFLSIVEVYDPKTNTWDEGTPLNSGRSGHASAVIYQPSCATNFMECMDSETAKRGGNGSFPDELPRSRNSNQIGPTSGSSYMHFHTSFGGTSCRKCDRDQQASEDIKSSNSNLFNPTLLDTFWYIYQWFASFYKGNNAICIETCTCYT
ncbi:kelch-like ECH-associated protein 1 isoform X2 [Rhagoletis pomonella]|uniref:kelch-like ECH-associated protein 1 isoform X2 n=1 Tax=Rhagoletis pomonella TaxID=28610 RepID=UPI0017868D18|nr:kelch-like ECH-associated protein 1 isoform X2 [Rhagoletis pomonella]